MVADRIAIETALIALDRLLQDDGSAESAYQAWFENHEVAFEAYGYRRFIPHPEIALDGEIYIPDFLVERLDGLWEIFELKRPDTKVLRDKARRPTFYAGLEEYYSQCRRYSQALQDHATRGTIEQKYNCVLQHDIGAVLIAGRKDHVDLRQVHSLMFDRGAKVAFQTYDDIRTRLEFYRARLFAKHEDLPGYSIHMVINPGKVRLQKNYIVDFGVDVDRDRISIFIDESDRLTFRVLDSSGTPYTTRVSLADAHIQYGKPVYLALELGLANDYSFVSVEANGTFSTDRRIDRLDINVDKLRHMVVGSNVKGTAHTNMRLAAKLLVTSTQTFQQRCDMRAYMFYRYFADPSDDKPAVEFSGNQHMHSSDHPNFRKGT